MQHYTLTIADQRAVTPRLMWLTVHAPELARRVRAGQYLLVRCSDEGSHDPLLRRPLFIAAAQEALGQIGLLYETNDRGLSWLARGRPNDRLDAIGTFGKPFQLGRRSRTLLLIGQGSGLAALLLLAHQATKQGCAVTLLALAETQDALPPPFLLPADIEYHTGLEIADFRLQIADFGLPITESGRTSRAPNRQSEIYNLQSAIAWADQVCAALPPALLPEFRDALHAGHLRMQDGYATVLIEGQLVCGAGACGICAIETRRGMRLLCSDGPVFDMRNV